MFEAIYVFVIVAFTIGLIIVRVVRGDWKVDFELEEQSEKEEKDDQSSFRIICTSLLIYLQPRVIGSIHFGLIHFLSSKAVLIADLDVHRLVAQEPGRTIFGRLVF